MIDFVKILIEDVFVDRLLKLPELDFKNEVSESTGEVSTKRTAHYHHCKIIMYDSGLVFFIGSIHKLFNSLHGIVAPKSSDKGFNGNLFTLDDIIEVREHLAGLFDCNPAQMVFQNIEFGVNTNPDFNPTKYINGLLYHKGEMFQYSHGHNLAQSVHQRFIFKIYNKGKQYRMNENVLRVELKIMKTAEIKCLGLKNFADVNQVTIKKAEIMLLKRFDEVVHYDYTINKESLSNSQKTALDSYSNPRYWIYNLKPNQRYRHKKRLQEITLNHSQNLHQKTRQEIIQKCSMINRLSENPKCSIINRSSIGLKIIQNTPPKINKKSMVFGLTKFDKKETVKTMLN